MIYRKHVTVTGHDYDATIDICGVLQGAIHSFNLTNTIHIDTHVDPREYKARVSNAILDIEKARYTKVIASRALDIKEKVDMPATLVKGRRRNTPARTFCFKQEGIEATGFSPELVVCVD
jgi:salicylate synthetase